MGFFKFKPSTKLFLLADELSDLIRTVGDLQYLNSQVNKRDRS